MVSFVDLFFQKPCCSLRIGIVCDMAVSMIVVSNFNTQRNGFFPLQLDSFRGSYLKTSIVMLCFRYFGTLPANNIFLSSVVMQLRFTPMGSGFFYFLFFLPQHLLA